MKSWVLRVDADLAEMPLHRFPRAARGDAHLLVVVAGGPAGGEGVAEPVAVVHADAVGDVGEGGRALVGRDHQIGVVAIEPDDVPRRHKLVALQVVGDVEQAADLGLVALDHFFHQRLALRRRPLHDKAAFRADRHDNRVLHLLRLDQAEDLAAEILQPVGPAEPATGDLAEPEMHGLDPRAIDEDLNHRFRQFETVDVLAVELERDVGLRPTAHGGLEEIGAQGAQNQVQAAPQDAVLIEIADVVERLFDLRLQVCRAAFRALAVFRVELRHEQVDQHAGDLRMAGHGRFDVSLAETHARLAEVFVIAAQHRDLAPIEAGAQHQAVETVVLQRARPDPAERLMEGVFQIRQLDVDFARGADVIVVDPNRAVVALHGDFVGRLADHPEAHMLQHRQHVGQRHRRAEAVELEIQRAGVGVDPPVKVHGEGGAAAQFLDALDVADRHIGLERVAISRRKSAAIAVVVRGAVRLAEVLDQRVLEIVGPVATRLDQPLLDIGDVQVARPLGGAVHDEVHPGHGGLAQMGVELDGLAMERIQ